MSHPSAPIASVQSDRVPCHPVFACPVMDVGNKYRQARISSAMRAQLHSAVQNVQVETGFRQEDYGHCFTIPYALGHPSAVVMIVADGHGSLTCGANEFAFGGFDTAKFCVQECQRYLEHIIPTWHTTLSSQSWRSPVPPPSLPPERISPPERLLPRRVVDDLMHIFRKVNRKLFKAMAAGAEPVTIIPWQTSLSAIPPRLPSEHYVTPCPVYSVAEQVKHTPSMAMVSRSSLSSSSPSRLLACRQNPFDGWFFEANRLLADAESGRILSNNNTTLYVDKVLVPFVPSSSLPMPSSCSSSATSQDVLMYVTRHGQLFAAEYGCTMTVAILIPTLNALHPWLAITAHVGDSDGYVISCKHHTNNNDIKSAVLTASPPKMINMFPLTSDHTTSSLAEVERMQRHGQKVCSRQLYFMSPAKHSELPSQAIFTATGLMIGRSFGHALSQYFGITVHPHVVFKDLSIGDVVCIASDGFWDTRWKWKEALTALYSIPPLWHASGLHVPEAAVHLVASLKGQCWDRDNCVLCLAQIQPTATV